MSDHEHSPWMSVWIAAFYVAVPAILAVWIGVLAGCVVWGFRLVAG